jgi:hypothetical protein
MQLMLAFTSSKGLSHLHLLAIRIIEETIFSFDGVLCESTVRVPCNSTACVRCLCFCNATHEIA